MSTRSQWSFRENGKQIALIYKHSDGYPNGYHGGFAVWERFIDKVIKDTATGMYGTRFADAEDLAARFIVFLAIYENKETTLNFGGIGVSKDLHGDIEYLYEIDCDSYKAPVLRCKSIYSKCYVDSDNNQLVKVKPSNPKGSIKVKETVYKDFNEFMKAKVPTIGQSKNINTPIKNKQCSNDSHLKLKRDSSGHFIKMDDIADFYYPHDGVNQFRSVKVVSEDDSFLEGVQINNGNTGYKRFNKNKIQEVHRYKGYV